MDKLICRIFYATFAVCWSVNGAFVTHPSNVAVSTNDAVVFTCATDDRSSNRVLIAWSYIAAGSAALPTAIASLCNVNDQYKSVYHTESSAAGVCNLIINSTQLANAGTYLCQDGQDSKYSTAELVVLEALTSSLNAAGNTAAESDTIQHTCNLTFRGSGQITPSIRWTPAGDPITGDIVTRPSADGIGSVYTVTARASNIAPRKCEVYFAVTNVTGPSGSDVIRVAQNKPTYKDSKSFSEVIVTYCRPSVMIPGVHNESTHDGGTLLHCSARGNPSPTFRWTNLTGDIDVTGSTFTVEANTFYVLTCTATNTITHSNGTQRTCSNRHTVVFNRPTKDGNLPLILGLSLGIGIPVLILIFILLLCCCCPCCPLYEKCHRKGKDVGNGRRQQTHPMT